jgi:hypothetical protein
MTGALAVLLGSVAVSVEPDADATLLVVMTVYEVHDRL